MSTVSETVLAYLPAKRKSTQNGWLSFNAPCCTHNGHSADTRGRGGLISNPDGGKASNKNALTVNWINIFMIIYKITSPSGKQYIGQSIHTFRDKCRWYKKHSKLDRSNRLIFNAIRKYGIENMNFELIEENCDWTKVELNLKEIYYINTHNTYYRNGNGYNMTLGGDGLDSESASRVIKQWYANMPESKKEQKSTNSSKAQKERFKNNPESLETREKKKKSHQGSYLIESPSGKLYKVDNGLKEFAEQNKETLGITYWQLFNAYRKTYSNTKTVRKQKNLNTWKVTRIDK